MTTTTRRAAISLAAVAVVAGLVVLVAQLAGIFGGGNEAAPIQGGPDPVASAFVHAYERGDTPTMCQLSTGEALSRLQAPGWCDTAQGWSTTASQAEHCTVPDGRQVYAYTMNPLVNGHPGMEIAVADTGHGVWRVVLFGHTADRTLCDIYN
jgi:hypothetical protein